MIYIIDYGSQYTGLIARKIKDCAIKVRIASPNHFLEIIIQKNNIECDGVIISGSPKTVTTEDLNWIRQVVPFLEDNNIPTLGICFGFQLLALHFDSTLEMGINREFGQTTISLTSHGKESELFYGHLSNFSSWMSHGNTIKPSKKIIILAESNQTITSYKVSTKNIYAVLFHPEVTHTDGGDQLFYNFLNNICKISTQEKYGWEEFIKNIAFQLKGINKIVCAVSGGVDSTVLAILLSKYCEVHAIYVDHGFQRSYDLTDLRNVFRDHPNIHLHILEKSNLFMNALKNTNHPDDKRKIMGKCFIDVLATHAKYVGSEYFAQGTIASDVIESGANEAHTAKKIKNHHNVGGLPKSLPFSLIEPLRTLYKDQVRSLGVYLNIPKNFINRHPFPGPGLSIRCLGEVTPSRIEKLRLADNIFYEEMLARNLYDLTWQAGVILLPVKSTGVMGDDDSYEECLVIRMVDSVDAMTANVSEVPWKDLKEISTAIINKVKGINRVVYDITSKPPATIEWE